MKFWSVEMLRLFGVVSSFVFSHAALALPFGNSLDTGLLAYYSFSGNANDDSGNGYDGTLYGGVNVPTLTTDRFGASNSAYAFNGGGYISTDLAIGNDNSISFWMKTPASGQLIMGPTNGLFYTWMFGIDASGHIFYGDYKTNVGGHVTLVGGAVNDGNWHHIFVFQDRNNASLTLYQDGVLVAGYTENGAFQSWGSGTNTGFGMVNNWTTANNVYPGVETYYTGVLDDIGFWNRELTGEELGKLVGAVPEPYEAVLFGLGIAGWFGALRNSKRRFNSKRAI